MLEVSFEVELFRKKGVDDRDSSGNTAVCIAVGRGFREIAKLLLSAGVDVRSFESVSKILLSVYQY
jgi:ankyrin repeat protein